MMGNTNEGKPPKSFASFSEHFLLHFADVLKCVFSELPAHFTHQEMGNGICFGDLSELGGKTLKNPFLVCLLSIEFVYFHQPTQVLKIITNFFR